mmetsp:Transcript_21754/g.49011  ORF Transcript_21754/g.49011 Transcript_21754/m.49011 type:complete len:310 (-) Transcript_21754:377-1306(-)
MSLVTTVETLLQAERLVQEAQTEAKKDARAQAERLARTLNEEHEREQAEMKERLAKSEGEVQKALQMADDTENSTHAEMYGLRAARDLTARYLKKNENLLATPYYVKYIGGIEAVNIPNNLGIQYCRELCLECKSCRWMTACIAWTEGFWTLPTTVHIPEADRTLEDVKGQKKIEQCKCDSCFRKESGGIPPFHSDWAFKGDGRGGYEIREEDEEVTTEQKLPNGVVLRRKISYSAAFVRYLRKEKPQHATAILHFIRDKYVEWTKAGGQYSIVSKLWNQETDREMTPYEMTYTMMKIMSNGEVDQEVR